jgi:superfamily II DNA or RNA helicase
VAEALQAGGLKAAAAHYKLAGDGAQKNFEAFTAGRLQVLTTVHMATEGYDVQGVDCVVMARVSDSEVCGWKACRMRMLTLFFGM